MKSADHPQRMIVARRSLDGLSLGDAFGERFFGPPEKVTQRIESRVFPGGFLKYTDDTIMAISVVDVLERFGRIDQDFLARLFAARYQKDPLRGYGGAAREILEAIGRGRDWKSVSSGAFNGSGSMGNGAAMRVSPLGAYFHGDLKLAAENASQSAEISHWHLEGKAGAIAVAVAASFLAGGGRLEELFDSVLPLVPKGETKEGIAEAASLLGSNDIAEVARRLGTGSQVLSQDTVPFCLWCVAMSGTDFEGALWRTVSGLGDRDTTCAIVGGIMASIKDVIVPADWLRQRESLDSFKIAME